MDLLNLFGYLLLAYLFYKFIDYVIRLPKISSLNTRYILVTGCDTGFGNAVAKRLDGMGCHVFAGCLTETGETDLRKSCSDRLTTINMDVSKAESIDKAYQVVRDALPNGTGLWGVLNNAGVSGPAGQCDWFHPEDYRKVAAVNLFGLVDVTHKFMPLIKRTKGRVVNTASVFGRFAMLGAAPYAITKFGVEAYSDCLRREMRFFGVSVHIIEPGFHKTNIVTPLNDVIRATFKKAPRHVQEEYGEQFMEDAITAFMNGIISGIVSEDISGVVDAYTHALTARFPRPRYLVGRDAKYMWLPLQYLPEHIGDFLIELLARINGTKPVPAACKR